MKKLSVILLSLILSMMVLTPALAEAPLTGGWSVSEDSTVSAEALAAFEKPPMIWWAHSMNLLRCWERR